MSNFIKLIVGTLSAIMLTVAVSFADMSGLSIGIVGNSSSFDTSGSETDDDGSVQRTSISEDVDFPSIFVEYTGGEAGGATMTVGFEYIPDEAEIGAKSRTDTNSGAGNDGGDDGTYTAKAQISDHLSAYIEPGYMINDNFAVYGKLGATMLTVTSQEDIAIGTDSSSYGNEEVFGAMYGVGFKAQSNFGAFLKLEHMTTEYQSITLTSITGNKNTVRADPSQESVRIAIGYNF